MSTSRFLFFGAAFVMALVVGVGIYLSRKGVFKKAADAAAQAAVQAVTQDLSKVVQAPPADPPKP